jgi:hypothetical protein
MLPVPACRGAGRGRLLLHGSAVVEHVGADTGLGFGVGGGVGVEVDGFGGTTVGHGARKDLAGKGYFLIDELAASQSHWTASRSPGISIEVSKSRFSSRNLVTGRLPTNRV